MRARLHLAWSRSSLRRARRIAALLSATAIAGAWTVSIGRPEPQRASDDPIVKCLDVGLVYGALDPEGTRLAFVDVEDGIGIWDLDRDARVWRASTGVRHSMTQEVHHPVAFSLDGRRVAHAGKDGVVRVWSAGDGVLLAELRHSPTSATHRLPNGRTMRFGNTFHTTAVVFGADGRWVATASFQGNVVVWDARTWSPVRTLWALDSTYLANDPSVDLALTDDGRTLLASTVHGSVDAWSTESWRHLGRMRHSSDWGASLAATPDGRVVALGARGGVRVWDREQGYLTPVLDSMPQPAPVPRLALTPDGTRLAHSLNFGGEVVVRDLRTGSAARLRLPGRGRASLLEFTPDGTKLVTAQTLHRTVTIWPSSGRHRIRIPSPVDPRACSDE